MENNLFEILYTLRVLGYLSLCGFVLFALPAVAALTAFLALTRLAWVFVHRNDKGSGSRPPTAPTIGGVCH